MSECKCNLSKRLNGDGCEVCNPAYAVEQYKDRILELEGENHYLKQVVKKQERQVEAGELVPVEMAEEFYKHYWERPGNLRQYAAKRWKEGK